MVDVQGIAAKGTCMTRNLSADVESLIRTLMATGKYRSEDELLREALERLNVETDSGDDLQAVREAIEELQQGDEGMELDAAFEVVREAVEKRLKA
jgi:Arc/MetJ-type ribon-helix-helix transcriptional regulator